MSDTGEVLKIPNQALRFRPSGADARSDSRPASQVGSGAFAKVWVIGADGQPSPLTVKMGVSDDNSSALLEGTLTEGRQVIVGVANSQNKAGYFGIRLGF